jgi:steroid 5-alpha reductase family enzyme
MYSLKKVEADSCWKYDELPPAALIKSLHLEPTTVDPVELSRAEWFWSRRPKILSESLSCIFFYLIVLSSLSYSAPGTLSVLLLWMVAGASCVSVDRFRLDQWRNEYELSIRRIVIHPSEQR